MIPDTGALQAHFSRESPGRLRLISRWRRPSLVSVRTGVYTFGMTVPGQRYFVDLIKTRPPQHLAGLVERQCLVKLQGLHNSGKSAFIAAPIGYGKTTLLVQFFDQLSPTETNAAWLSLSEHDADATHFLSGVTAALQGLEGSLGSLTQSLLTSGLQVSHRVILATLINEILLYEKPVTLFLDDLYRADSEDFIEALSELLENSPANLRFVLASRTSIPAFRKLIVRSRLAELNAEDLRVNYPEAEQLLRKACPERLSSANVFSLLERIDGWINGLQIAALSINAVTDVDAYIRDFSGKGRDFSDYIEQDIFARLPQDVQQFLVETSILEMLTPELCDVVTQRPESARLLSDIEKMNLFVTCLDRDRRCYRYHHFFRDFLQSKLSSDPSIDRVLVHRRAYDWCLKNSLENEAIDHMVAAEDWNAAAQTIAGQLQSMLSKNGLPTLRRWVMSLPEDLVKRRPILLLSLGWVAALSREPRRADNYLKQVEELLHAQSTNADPCEMGDDQIHSNIEALRSVIIAVGDDGGKLSELARSDRVRIPPDHRFFHYTHCAARICALMYEGQYDQGHRLATELEALSHNINFRAVVYTRIFRGLGYRLAGRLYEAKEQYDLAQSIARKKFGVSWTPFVVPNALLAELHYEWADTDKAAELLVDQEVVLQESSVIEPLVCAYQVGSRLALGSGDSEHALQLLADGEALGRRDNYVRLVAAMMAERVRQLLARDELGAADVVYRDLCDLALRQDKGLAEKWSEVRYYATLGISRYLLATKSADKALALLTQQGALARKQSQNRHLLKLLLLEASALLQMGKQHTAENRILEALTLGAEGGFRQSFCDTDHPVRELICAKLGRWSVGDAGHHASLDVAYIRSLGEILGVEPGSAPAVAPEADLAYLEPLTPREITLLQLLSRGMKNKELANEVHLSVHTVAWHLKNLYSKLGVDNRTAAVNVARQRKLG